MSQCAHTERVFDRTYCCVEHDGHKGPHRFSVVMEDVRYVFARAERYRMALAELVEAIDSEAKAKANADNALENFSNPSPNVDAYAKAMVRTVKAMDAARAALRGEG